MSVVRVHVTVTCPACNGAGEIGYEPHDWWHGSGVNVVTWECPLCHGYGDVAFDTVERWRTSECECGTAMPVVVEQPKRHASCHRIGADF